MRTALAVVALSVLLARASAAQTPGAQLYASACAACHGADGKGAAPAVVGVDTPLPDFTDCHFSTTEADPDWEAVIRRGGPARGFSRLMPAFGDALTAAEIDLLIRHLRQFCRGRRWPSGNLNLPRAFVTEKAFPENEVVAVISVPATYTNRADLEFVYEQRLGARSQYELSVPFSAVQGVERWTRGIGDIGVAFKHAIVVSDRLGSIVGAGAEMRFPTGDERTFHGSRLTVFEPFASVSQVLPHDGFVHGQLGWEIPLNAPSANNEFFWRAAIGKTFVQGDGGRAWSPMVEVLGARDLAPNDPRLWDLLPELHVTLSRRQHIALSGGVRFPVNRRTRSPSVLISLLWDWKDGGVFSGW